MAGGWSLGLGLARAQAEAIATATSNGVSVSTGGSQFVKGSWQQITASTPLDSSKMVFIINPYLSLGNVTDFDVAYGASGSETLFIADLLEYMVGPDFTQQSMPLCIPAGVRLSARCWTNYAGADSANIAVYCFDSGFQDGCVGSVVETSGFLENHFYGTQVDPGPTANTKSAWVQISASTGYDYQGFVFGWDQGGNEPTGASPAWYSGLLDIGVGPSGSEQVIVSNYPLKEQTYQGCGWSPTTSIFFPISIPAGTRVAVRLQSGNTTATYRILGVTLYGVGG